MRQVRRSYCSDEPDPSLTPDTKLIYSSSVNMRCSVRTLIGVAICIAIGATVSVVARVVFDHATVSEGSR